VALGGTSLRQADVDASTLDASTAIGFLVGVRPPDCV
jgi:hypothetical protein